MLKQIDLEIGAGESIGIVGANGSGKSTLLKLIAGITEPSSGEIEIEGRVLGVIELGAGFHLELSGEENARLQGAIYGLSARETDERIDPIFDYAELQDFRSTALKHYSSGMIVRLGFSIAIHCRPEILLVDEVLAVGDQSFQEKCLRTIDELRRAGTTIIFVTHHMEFAERICDRIVWLKKGTIHRHGPALEVLQAYQREMLAEQYAGSEGAFTLERAAVGLPGRFGTGEARITEARTVDAEGRVRRNFLPGEPICIEVDYTCEVDVAEIDCAIMIDFEDGTNVAFWRAGLAGAEQRPTKGGRFRLYIPSPPLLPGRYTISPAISRPGGREDHYDLHLRLYHFSIAEEGAEMVGVPVGLEAKVRWR